MKRGSLFWVNLEPSSPPEFGKVLPAVVISNSAQNMLLPSVVVLPLSSKQPEIWPLRIKLKIPGKKKASYAITAGIRQVSKARLYKAIGEVTPESLSALDKALNAYLSD